MLKSLVLLAAAASTAVANMVTYNWDIEWVTKSPDGKLDRPVIGINGEWPLPTVVGYVGDTVKITINNKLGNESTGIHWHGLHQIKSNHMDGPAGATQCPVPPGSSFTYEFKLDQSGTYWYHSHTGSQYPDGLRGAFIVKDKIDPFAGQYDEEYVITVSDWYHKQVPAILSSTVFNKTNTQTRPPLPQSGLINDGLPATYKFTPGKKYKFRVINISALTGVMFFIEDHVLSVIEIDGVYVKPEDANQLFITPAQRYSFIVEAKEDATKNYGISAVFDINPNFRAPVVPFTINATGTIEYDASLGAAPQYKINAFDLLDDMDLEPLVPSVLGPTDVQIQLDFNLGVDSTGFPRAFINGKPYIHQKVPTLYTVLSAGPDAEDVAVYGEVNPFIVKKNQVVELIVNNLHFAHHPFHFHGHHFQVCSRPAGGAGKAGDVECLGNPMTRDTVTIEGNSFAVLRFKADNPGVWLFHCHIEWHVPLGLSATIIEDPLEIQKTIKVPKEHFEVCAAGCMPYEGNAGGNTKDYSDLSNANNVPEDSDPGAVFTASTCPANPPTSSSAAPSGSATSTPAGSVTSSIPAGSITSSGSLPSSTPAGDGEWTTSTLYSTTTYTVTSCKPEVTNCPHTPYVTTEVVPYTTTVCPVTKTALPTSVPADDDEWTTSTLYSTKTFTITSCKPEVTNCPHTPYVTTQVVPYTTTVCPVTKTAPWPDFYTLSTLYSTTTYTVTSCKPEVTNCPHTPYVTTEVVPWTSTVPIGDAWPTAGITTLKPSYGTAAPTATTTGKGLHVTAGAAKAAGGFGAAAVAGVLAAALL
jgi:iron transport multicopper oxidase